MANFSLTITGADDLVDPRDLDALGEAYPFVEWAILFSATKQGQPRYPSKNWRKEFYDATCLREEVGYHTAAHLCGDALIFNRLQSLTVLDSEIETNFDTVQFNSYLKGIDYHIYKYAQYHRDRLQTIVQYNQHTSGIIANLTPDQQAVLSILCDESGGTGKMPTIFCPDVPLDFLERQAVGYAGGITEHNIEQVLEHISQQHGNHFFWIDLETGARDPKDRFDIDKVERILELADQFIDFDEVFETEEAEESGLETEVSTLGMPSFDKLEVKFS